ncbi:MAG: beta-ketoacyl synthase N-terminal-like domain-containing protein [Thermodesulfobacteriota bacterium]|nr:beta-ketoacyl synthase N-terminal-like domain-containing protein [Thermodesulfobacteriota bacterium]
MRYTANILGVGWVDPSSMGRPGHLHKFETPEEMFRLSGKFVLNTPYKPFGRMDQFAKLGFSAIAFAMTDAGISPVESGKSGQSLKRSLAVIAESTTGCLETDLSYQAAISGPGPYVPSPALFAYTLPSCFLGEAAIYYGLKGEAYMVEKQKSTGLTALSFAMDNLYINGCEAAVCGTCNSGPGTSIGKTGLTPGAIFLVIGPGNLPMPSTKGVTPSILTRTQQTNTRDRFYLGDNEITDLTCLVEKDVI